MKTIVTAALGLCMSAAAGHAAYIDNVTPDVIFGSGNANGSFTGVRENNVELGLRGKLRFNNSGAAENTFNYTGNATYEFEPSDGNPPSHRSLFNFEFSINSDLNGDTDGLRTLDELTYLLSIDHDPSSATNFYSYDVINGTVADHAFGFNSTGNGDGVTAGNPADPLLYSSYIDTYNVAQQSWNYGFTGDTGFPLDPQTQGLYTIGLSAFDGQTLLASTSIDIRYGEVPPVPLPATLPLLAAALGGAGFLARRRKS